MGTLSNEGFSWLNREHTGGFAATRPATSGKVRHAKCDAVRAIPDASGAPENAAAFVRLKLQRPLRNFDFPSLEADCNRPLVIPHFTLKSSRDLLKVSAQGPQRAR